MERLDEDDYLVLAVESGLAAGNPMRARVRRVDDGEELVAVIPFGFKPEHVEALKNGERSKRALRLQVNVTRVGGKVMRAAVVQAELAG